MNPSAPSLQVTVLGSGTCVPSLSRSACSVWVSAGGQDVLLDIGPGTMRRLVEAGKSIFDIRYLMLSHFHPDHSGELAAFLFSNKYPDGSLRKKPLTLFGGKGFMSFFQGLVSLYGSWVTLAQQPLETVELTGPVPEGCRPEGFGLACAPVRHNPESLAYRITAPDGASVVYSGDTDVCDSLVHLARGASVLICESAMPDGQKVPGHLTPSEAGDIAARAGVGLLVLTHFYPQCDAADIGKQCRRTWNGPLILAEDLMSIPVARSV